MSAPVLTPGNPTFDHTMYIVPLFGPLLLSTAMHGNELTRMFFPVMVARIPLILLMILVAGI